MSWYLMHRGWMKNPAFRDDWDRMKWIWLIEHAVWKETHIISIKNNPVELKRGQLSYSIRYLAKAWGCDPQKIRTYIKHLEKWHMINTSSNTGQTVITICNYSKYQDSYTLSNTGLSQNATQGQHRPNTNKKEGIKKDKEYNKEIAVPDFIDGDVWMNWINHRNEIKKKLTPTQSKAQIKKLTKWYEQGYDVNKIINQSIQNGWQGLFEPKDEVKKNDITNQARKLLDEIGQGSDY